jgi:hypothetical protein
MVAGLVIIGGSVFGGIALASGHGDPTQPSSTTSPTDSHGSPSTGERDDDGNVGSGGTTTAPGASTGDRSNKDDGKSCEKDDATKADAADDGPNEDATTEDATDDGATNDSKDTGGCDPASE